MHPNENPDKDQSGSYFFGGEDTFGDRRSTGAPPPRADRPRGSAGPSGPGLPEGRLVILQGTVRGHRERTEQEQFRNADGSHGTQSLTTVVFRLDTYDGTGNRTGSFPVQLRGESFTGQLSDSDEVRVTGVVRGGVVHTDVVQDARSGALFQISPESRRRAAQRKRSSLFRNIAVGVFVVVLVVVFIATQSPAQRPQTAAPGPQTAAPTPLTVVMPNVVGEAAWNAAQLLANAQIDGRHVLHEDVPSSHRDFAKVLRTDPPARATVSPTTIVRLYEGDGSQP